MKNYDQNDLWAGYGLKVVEKRRALEAFLDGFSEEGLKAYHDWHESAGRAPYHVHSRYGRKIEIEKTGLDGTQVKKKAELRQKVGRHE